MFHKKSDQMLQNSLEAQLKFLDLSSKSYDNGFEDEAIRLAQSLRVLLHDGRDSSVLTQLKQKNNLLFATSISRYIPINAVSYIGLSGMSFEVGGESKYVPICNQSDETQNFWIGFDDWWNQIIIDDKINIFTRRDVVLYAANKDGGAHVDPKIEHKYYELIFNNSIGWETCIGDESKPMDNNIAYTSIRQIAHEFLFSFNYFQVTLSFTRSKSAKEFQTCYIGSRLYFHESLEIDDIREALYVDNRVTKRENRKVYHDNMKLKNGSLVIRNVVIR